MEFIEAVEKIEKNINVADIKINGISIWAFLRNFYLEAYKEKSADDIAKVKISRLEKFKRLKNITYNIGILLKLNKYDYIIFTDTYEKRKKDNIFIDKISESLENILNKYKVLIIENPFNSGHFKKYELSAQNILSLDLFLILGKIFSIFHKSLRIEKEELIILIEKELGVHVDYKKHIKRFFSQKFIFGILLGIVKPKAVFMNCYDCSFNQSAILSAKKNKIPVAELQHGFINDKHPSYNIFANLGNDLFPDYLFSFGDYVKDYFSGGNFFLKKENIIPVGNYYIDYINKEYKPAQDIIKKFDDLRQKYKKIIVISSQWTVEDRLVDFLRHASLLDDKILFLLVPRNLNKNYTSYDLPDNFTIWKNKDIDLYKLMKLVDFHATVYSSFALEAPAMGISNILININNLAKNNYEEMLDDERYTKFVNTPEELVNIISEWEPKSKEEIKILHSKFYEPEHEKALKNALNKVYKTIKNGE